MALESLHNKIDITRLNIEPPMEKERPGFDPDHDITLDQWTEILGSLHKTLLSQNVNSYDKIRLAAACSWVSPERFEQSVTNVELFGIIKHFRDLAAKYQTDSINKDYASTQILLRMLADGRAFLPQAELKSLTENAALRVNVVKLIDHRLGFQDFQKHLETLASTRIVWPQGIGEIALNWRELKDNVLYDFLHKQDDKKDWFYFAENTAYLRIISPKEFSEISIDANMWQSMRDELKEYWDGHEMNTQHFMEMAKNMSVISAGDIKIDEAGLHIIQDKSSDSTNSAAALPETRSF